MARDRERHESIVHTLEAAGLDAMVVFSPAHVLLLTGYWPVMGCSMALMTRAGDPFVLLPEDERELAEATSDAELLAYKPATLERLSKPAVALTEPIRLLAHRVKLGAARVGVCMEGHTQPSPYPATHHFRESEKQLVAELAPRARLTAVDELLSRLQAVKTKTELALMRRACERARCGFDAGKGAIAEGRREDEVAAEAGAAFARVANDGFKRGFGDFFCMSGPNSTKASGAYARTRRRMIERRDLVMIHANTTGDGYWTDITRTYMVGEASEEQARMQGAIAEARGVALQRIAPGVKARDVDAAARDVLTKHGFGAAFKHGTGHGVGFAAADANARPRLHPASDDVLEEGMTFNVEPAIYLEGVGGMRHCDVVACTAKGAEVLTNFEGLQL